LLGLRHDYILSVAGLREGTTSHFMLKTSQLHYQCYQR
jgi:hypothetical protein